MVRHFVILNLRAEGGKALIRRAVDLEQEVLVAAGLVKFGNEPFCFVLFIKSKEVAVAARKMIHDISERLPPVERTVDGAGFCRLIQRGDIQRAGHGGCLAVEVGSGERQEICAVSAHGKARDVRVFSAL